MATGFKKHSREILIFCLTAILFFGCTEDLFNGDDQIVKGLKEALKIGTQNATRVLGVQDGYLKDEAVRILLPEGAQPAFEVTSKVAGTINDIKSIPIVGPIIQSAGIEFGALGGDLVGTFVTAFNRSAEKAAPEAVGIFTAAITDMTISDGKNILFTNDSIAATKYLFEKTFGNLIETFNPVVNESMMAVTAMKVGSKEYNTLDAWDLITSQNNKLYDLINSPNFKSALNNPIAAALIKEEQLTTINSIQHVNTNLGSYVVEKALSGIFNKVEKEETKIRANVPGARANDLLQDVFSQLDEWKNKNK